MMTPNQISNPPESFQGTNNSGQRKSSERGLGAHGDEPGKNRAVQIGEEVDFVALVLLGRLRLRPGLQNQVANAGRYVLPLKVAQAHLP